MPKKIDKFESLKAWCEGKSYNKPTDFMVAKARNGYYALHIYTRGVYLARFSFRTEKEALKGIGIVLKNLKR